MMKEGGNAGGNNWLPTDKRVRLIELILTGKYSTREIAKMIPCAKGTITRYRDIMRAGKLVYDEVDLEPRNCPCGEPYEHRGWCSYRFAKSPGRQEFMKRWRSRYAKKETGMTTIATKKKNRTSKTLRDMLFDEIDDLREGTGEPVKAMAVANLAKQIINIAKIELDYHREALKHAEMGKPLELGVMQLGSDSSAANTANSGISAARRQ